MKSLTCYDIFEHIGNFGTSCMCVSHTHTHTHINEKEIEKRIKRETQESERKKGE